MKVLDKDYAFAGRKKFADFSLFHLPNQHVTWKVVTSGHLRQNMNCRLVTVFDPADNYVICRYIAYCQVFDVENNKQF